MGKYYSNKTLIYLDQFAISNLVDQEEWFELRDLLYHGVQEGVFLIPYSAEHMLETSVRTYEKAKAADELLFSLSRKFALDSEPMITTCFLLFAIRKVPVDYRIFSRIVQAPALEGNAILKYQLLNRTFREMVGESTMLLNLVRSVGNGKRADNQLLQIVLNEKKNQYLSDLLVRLKAFSLTGTYERQSVAFSMITIPYWADIIMDGLIGNDLTQVEASEGVRLLSQLGLNIVPTIMIRASLEAIFSVKNQKETAADHLDILRLCVAIPFADVVVTDKSKVFDLQTLGFDEKFQTELFSGSTKDIERLHDKLALLMH
ncbi:MAG: hypothetical protein IPP69_08120 [Flavobacteriales bacterium]|jgi:hypothetical protein|nr:hypothetical protein [Flavobacteriales bacterium]